VEARKGFFGRKTIDDNTFKALMNRESRNADRYAAKSPEFKLLDLLYRAAGEIVDTKFDNIN
jgi:DNA-binding winged helix-turn-helix (wHTH) protein